MNVYIITENNFFFIGIKMQLLLENGEVKKLHPNELKINSISKFHKDDVFIFHASNFSLGILFMVSLGEFSGRFMFIPTKRKVKYNMTFKNFPFLDAYVTIDEIKTKIINGKYHNLDPYEIENLLTKQEKIILNYTFNGMNAHKISRRMSISIKTVYSHRRKAFHKLGGRNLFDIWPLKGCLLLS